MSEKDFWEGYVPEPVKPAQQVVDCHAAGVCVQSGLRAEQPAQQDIPDLIAGALGVSRGTAYDMMREALAEAQQEPAPVQQKPMRPEIKKMYEDYFDKCFREFSTQRKPLTEGEIERMWFQQADIPTAGQRIVGFARAIEAAHGIKGDT